MKLYTVFMKSYQTHMVGHYWGNTSDEAIKCAQSCMPSERVARYDWSANEISPWGEKPVHDYPHECLRLCGR